VDTQPEGGYVGGKVFVYFSLEQVSQQAINPVAPRVCSQ